MRSTTYRDEDWHYYSRQLSNHSMSLCIFDIITAVIVTTMVGNEFAIAAFVHPQLYRLPSTEHARVASLLARVLGGFMPFWYGLCLLLLIGAAYEHRPLSGGAGLLLACAALLWAGVIVLTVSMLVPINNRIADLDAAAPYSGWLADRARWDNLHRIRVLILTIAVILLLTALLGTTN